jgi:tol-pal system protein YbgF
VRHLFALALLVASARLWLALSTIPTGLPVSEAHEQNSRHIKIAEDDWLHAFEGVMDGTSGRPDDPARQFYDRVMAEVTRQHYDAAAAGFRLFLELHPLSPLAPQADYWLGECEYRLGQYQEAIESFDHALSRVPLDPQLAPAAFLRKGTSYAKLGDESRSRNLLELLVVQYPTTQEAVLARQTLLIP